MSWEEVEMELLELCGEACYAFCRRYLPDIESAKICCYMCRYSD